MDGTNHRARRIARWSLTALAVTFVCAWGAHAAPNITNTTQKGSLLVFPDIDTRDGRGTIVRLANDGSIAIDVKCTWLDGNKHRTDFVVTLTKNQTIWFEAGTGEGTIRVNRFPYVAANGFDNPFLPGGLTPYGAGMLVCFAVDAGTTTQVKWNHLTGSATVFDPVTGSAYEYRAYAFFAPMGADFSPLGTPGLINLNGTEYDSCPLYQVASFAPAGVRLGELQVLANRLTVTSCSLDLRQDWYPALTKLQFDVWNSDETKFSGAFECADGWHETNLVDIDASPQNFALETLHTDAARYRVQAVKSQQCPESQAAGLIGIHSTLLAFGLDQVTGLDAVGTNLTAAGKLAGKVLWDPDAPVPEGGIR
jgi:hypothetical protein